MPPRNNVAKIAAVFTLVCCCGLSAYPQTKAGQTRFIVNCGSGQGQERIFANPGGKSWREYSSVKKVPQVNGENGESIFAVRIAPGFSSVRWMYAGEDNSVIEESCFSKTGELRSLHYEMRTAWGWGYEEHKVLSASGATLQRKKRFFDTDSNRTIARPHQADDVPNFLEPEIYSSFNSLPFIATLNKPRTDATQK
jgi:hypothetical protein